MCPAAAGSFCLSLPAKVLLSNWSTKSTSKNTTLCSSDQDEDQYWEFDRHTHYRYSRWKSDQTSVLKCIFSSGQQVCLCCFTMKHIIIFILFHGMFEDTTFWIWSVWICSWCDETSHSPLTLKCRSKIKSWDFVTRTCSGLFRNSLEPHTRSCAHPAGKYLRKIPLVAEACLDYFSKEARSVFSFERSR